MIKRFYLHDKIILLFLAVNYFVITGIPGLYSMSKIIYPIQTGLFLLFLSFYLNFDYISIYQFPRLNFTYILIIVSFVLFFVSSFIINWNFNANLESISKLITYPIIFYLFFIHLAYMFYYNDDLYEKFLNSLVLFGFITALIALLMFIVGIHISKYEYAATGYFGHPNTSAFMYTIAIPILFYEYFTKRYSLFKFILILVPLLVGLLFSYSRSAYIGVFISILVITFKKSKVIFIFTCLCLLFLITNFFIGFATAKGDSSYPRMLLFFAAYDMIFNSGSRHLFWGYGIFQNINVFRSEKVIFGSIEDVPDPHNMILLLSIQFGVLLTINFLITFIFLIVRSFFRKKSNNINSNEKINLSLSIIIGLFAHNMLEDIIVYPEYFIMPLFLIFSGYLYYSTYYQVKVNS